MVIYKTINLINGHYYIGKDAQNKRSYYGSGIILGRAIRKYGKKNFEKIILEHCIDNDHLNEREKYWINLYDAANDVNSYNIAEGGHGGNTNAYHKVGRKGELNSMYAHVYTDEERKKSSDFWKSFHENEDPIKKAERLRKMSETQKDRPKNPSSVEKMKKSDYHSSRYILTSPEGEIFELNSATELKNFCRSQGLNSSSVGKKLVKGIQMTKGKWVGWTAIRIKNYPKMDQAEPVEL